MVLEWKQMFVCSTVKRLQCTMYLGTFYTLALFDALLIHYGRVVVVVAAGLAEGRTMPESRAGGRSD